MGRPTAQEAKEMQYRKLVKEIWVNEFNRAKDELVVVLLGTQFVEIKANGKELAIHTSFFEDYFGANSNSSKAKYRDLIKQKLEQWCK